MDKREGGRVIESVLVEDGILKSYRKDGTVLSARTLAAKVSPENPMTYDEVADNLRLG
jgi:hypothetical protein